MPVVECRESPLTLDETTVALLTGWLDYHPWPETWTAQLQRRATKHGPAPSRVTCKTCHGQQWLGKFVCWDCKGRGWFTGDAYTEERVHDHETPFADLLHRQTVLCDGCGGWGRLSAYANQEPGKEYPLCDKCMGTGKVGGAFTGVCRPFRVDDTRERIGDRGLDGMAREHERRDDVDVYRLHLEPAMVDLRIMDRGAHFLVCWVYVMGAEPRRSLREPRRFLLDSAVVFLSARLPLDRRGRVVGVPSEVYAAAARSTHANGRGRWASGPGQKTRDDAIRKRHGTGNYTSAELGRYFGVSDRQIRRILAAGA